ncbi:MAG: hypothetical protein ABR498_03015 [Candidatus Dormibacteria bacterium]
MRPAVASAGEATAAAAVQARQKAASEFRARSPSLALDTDRRIALAQHERMVSVRRLDAPLSVWGGLYADA